MTTLDQAKIQIEANGASLPVGHPKPDGKIHRYGLRKKYWYKLNEIRLDNGNVVYSGSYGFWQGDNENKEVIAMDWTDVSPEERKRAEAERRELERQEAEKKAQEAHNAAMRAGMQWRDAAREGHSEYVQRKQITAPGVRYERDGTILIPAVVLAPGEQPRLVALQKIAPNGEKRFNGGSVIKGACCPIGRIAADDSIISLSEGYATARTVSMATDDSIGGYLTFNAGNIPEVAAMARRMHPAAHILICADDDYQLEKRAAKWMLDNFRVESALVIDGVEHAHKAADGADVRVLATWKRDARGVSYIEVDARAGRRIRTGTFENAGIARATEAARAIGNASIVCPRFTGRGDNKWTDFNDLHVQEGLDAVREQLAAAIFAALNAAAGDDDSATVPADRGDQQEPVDAVPHAESAAAAGSGDEPPDWPGEGAGVAAGSNPNKWMDYLSRSDKGNVLPTLSNVYTILVNHQKWHGVIAYDEFSGQVVKLKPPPFARTDLGEWSDMDDLRCTLWMQQTFGFSARQDVVMGAVLLVADLNKYHVVRNYLDGLRWDGAARLDRWLIDLLGAADIPYNAVVARKWLIAAVARIYEPGCKADNVLILEGEQGLYKSTALKVLGGEWFTDAPFRLGDKDAYIVIRGKWLVELAELDSFNKAESTGAKLFFGQYVDRYRTPYGKRAVDVPRQQLFAGTTNSDTYLKDDTGNRRYWPVLVTLINLEALRLARDQIWAEAVHMYRSGMEWWPTSAEKEMFEEQQEERYVGDAWTSLIRTWLVGRSQATMTEILGDCLKLDTVKWTRPEQQRVGRCMSEIGWKRKRDSKSVAGKRDWIYVPPSRGGAQGGEDAPF